MKRMLSLLLILLLMPLPHALAAGAGIDNVLADDSVLTLGEDWFVEFNASSAGEIELVRTDGRQEEVVVHTQAVTAGANEAHWDGTMSDGSLSGTGYYGVLLKFKDTSGQQLASHMVSVEIVQGVASLGESEAFVDETESAGEESGEEPGEEADDQTVAETGEEDTGTTEKMPVPSAANFWEMNPDEYDLDDPDHQQAIWDIMMQDMTVLDVGQREHVYPTVEAGASLRPRTNIAGELHGESQGVNVLEEDTDGDGYVKIQAYSNDGTAIESSVVIDKAAKLIEGYVKKRQLRVATPSKKYGILVDKLRQSLYIFKDGAIIGELKISTGFNTKEQPYNETPSGEYFTISRVGQFISGNMYCNLGIRINGGVLLHEVPHKLGSDGKTPRYANFEQYLGQKASHGCIRIQRLKNENGQNMQWLWSNLELKTKVLVWEDSGREMPAPEMSDDSTPLYYNPNGGSNYHLSEYCPGVKDRFLPLTGGFTYGDLDQDEYKKLTPCSSCGAPERKETILENYEKAAKEAGAVIPEDVLGLWDNSTETDQEQAE